MGNGTSKEEQDKVGYRVLGVQANSPASRINLINFFDFIIRANGINLNNLDTTFIDLIKASEDKPLPLTIYNCKNHSTREVVIVPSKNWPGEGMLGVTIRFDSYHDAEEHVIHVLEVEHNSPAELAGLIPFQDYLLGTAEKVFKDADILFQELKENLDKPVEFYVYNAETDMIRVVVIMPSEEWGGEGILGANIAHGFLHGLPSSACSTIGLCDEEGCHRIVSSPFGVNSGIDNVGSTFGSSASKGVIEAKKPAPESLTTSSPPPNAKAQLYDQFLAVASQHSDVAEVGPTPNVVAADPTRSEPSSGPVYWNASANAAQHPNMHAPPKPYQPFVPHQPYNQMQHAAPPQASTSQTLHVPYPTNIPPNINGHHPPPPPMYQPYQQPQSVAQSQEQQQPMQPSQGFVPMSPPLTDQTVVSTPPPRQPNNNAGGFFGFGFGGYNRSPDVHGVETIDVNLRQQR